MARVSITQAAKLAGISRASLYKSYLEKGAISVSKDSSGKKYIDTAELLRVFGELKGDSIGVTVDNSPIDKNSQQLTAKKTVDNLSAVALSTENELLRQQLLDAREREQFYQEQIKELTSTVKLLDAPKYPRLWWQFWK